MNKDFWDFQISGKTFRIQGADLTSDCFSVASVPRPYTVEWDPGLRGIIRHIKEVLTENPRCFLLVDSAVWKCYFQKENLPLKQVFLMDAEEEKKNIQTVLDVISRMNDIGFGKADKLMVAGGGITQDIGAFAGCIFKRGIAWEFYPTTLLSMCDSCIGGKTGINFQRVKNQLALFSAPRRVVICPGFLETLSAGDVRSGYGEILKLAVTGGKDFADLFAEVDVCGKEKISGADLKKLIWIALMVKKAVIEADEFELDWRRALNYGHTVGHAVEVMSGYKIPHGQAVAIGMVAVNQLAVDAGMLADSEHRKISRLARTLFDALQDGTLDFSMLEDLLLKDKKTEEDSFVLVMIRSCGDTLFQKYPKTSLTLEKIKQAIQQAVQ